MSNIVQEALNLRRDVRLLDLENIREIVESTGFFNRQEVAIAVELVAEHLEKGAESGYFFIIAEQNHRALGYSCYGPIPATQSSYDLYWIAVRMDARGTGIGKILMAETEKAIREAGGTRVYIETSGRDLYEPTRAFYKRCGYREDAVLADFYAPGDGKYIYVRELDE